MIRRMVRLARRLWELGTAWSKDLLLCSYARERVRVRPLLQSLDQLPSEVLLSKELMALYEANHFDLLGSGWCDWSLGQECNLVNRANRRHANTVRRMIAGNDSSIDWHLEPRADYRYPVSRWSRWIRPAQPTGVDIKLPWELSRMQHLVPLALSAVGQRDLLAGRADRFRNQVLDFIAANPPRFGVNWRTPMDVAIRAANWVVTISIYHAAGYEFDEEFVGVLGASLLDHGRHIIDFMEWDPQWRGNHYLANLCGLVIIAAALPASSETDAWLNFAVQELHSEVLRQINPDGSVFEASTGYHRLSLEMVVYATAVVLGVIAGGDRDRLRVFNPGQVKFKKSLSPGTIEMYPLPGNDKFQSPLSPDYFSRLLAAGDFTRDICMPDGRMPLIGDNDSGRFIKLRVDTRSVGWEECADQYSNLQSSAPVEGVSGYPVEEQRDIRYLRGLLSGLLDDPELIDAGSRWSTERKLIGALSGGLLLSVPRPQLPTELSLPGVGELPANAKQLHIELPTGAGDDVYHKAYPDFGLYILRGPRLFLAVRCGSIGQGGFGGHAHNDQLGLVLQVDGKDWIADPGVYRYTVDSDERRRYRSVQAHFAPRVGDLEPGDLSLGPWRLGNEAQARVEYFADGYFQGRHLGYGRAVHRRVWLEGDRLLIADWGDDGLLVDSPAVAYAQLNRDGALLPFCPAYGVQHAGA